MEPHFNVRVAVLILFTLLLLGNPLWGQSAEEIKKLIAQLGDEDETVRRSAGVTLGCRIGAPAVPELISAMFAENKDVRRWAAYALGQIGPQSAPAAIPALAAALTDEDLGVRKSAALALGWIGPKAAPAIPALDAGLRDENYGVRSHVVSALGSLGPKAVPSLVKALSLGDRRIRANAVASLAEIGPGARPAVPRLIVALDSDDAGIVRGLAAIALAEIGPDAAPVTVPALIKTLSGKDVEDPTWVTTPLGKIGTDLKAEGVLLWWVVPRVYWKQLVGLVFAIATWLALLGRYPRQRPRSKNRHLAFMGLTAVVPVILGSYSVLEAVTQDWAEGFLPDTLTFVPFPVAAVLSTAMVCGLLSIWVCQRKPEASIETVVVM